jgi:predicted signal transduction protein with EAL and GGDEF domain
MAEPFEIEGHSVVIGTSAGIALAPNDGTDPDELLKNADMALYRAKAEGRGTYRFFEARMDADMQARRLLEMDLRGALARNEFEVHYQPLVDLASAKLNGFEALLRWHHPERGLVSPGEFIPLAEEMGLIGAIGDWVLSEICRQSRAWTDANIPLRIGFNMSPRQLWQPDLAQRVLLRLQSAGVEPSRVTIEITESAAMSDPDRTQRVLQDLYDSGLHLAIDDFGTGYSSLSRLKYMPVNLLKIDRSFVKDIPGDSDAASIVRAIIQMGRSLGMTPLAEGIETEDQWRFLVDNGCVLGQGYLFSKPVPADEIEAMLQRRGGLHLVHDADRPAANA